MRLPYWHETLDECTHDGRLASHCPVLDRADSRLPAVGFVPCQPEALRNRAEKRLADLDIKLKSLSLDAYSVGRLLRSEWPTATAETKIAVAECVANLAKQTRTTPTQLVLKNQHNVPLYGRIAQGRDFDTSLDPTVGDLEIAHFALSGKSQNFARLANSYAHTDQLGDQLVPLLQGWMQQNAWVGPLPNVPLSSLILFQHVGPKLSPAHRAANDQALLALQAGQPLETPTETDPHPRWNMVKAIGAAAGTGLLLFGVGAAFTEFYEKRWKTWKES